MTTILRFILLLICASHLQAKEEGAAKVKDAVFHLKQIDLYEAYMNNPANYREENGFMVIGEHPTIDKQHHLEALVKLKAIIKKEFTFKTALNTRENTLCLLYTSPSPRDRG